MVICSFKKKIGDFLFEKRECPTTKNKNQQNILPNDKILVPKKNKIGANSFEDTSLLNSDAH
jgi:hypothetical protein